MSSDIAPENRAYRPFGHAADLFSFGTSHCPYQGREMILSGGVGTGKSRACLEKMHACATKYEGFRGLIVRQTRSSLTDSVLPIFEDHVLPKNSPIKSGPHRENRHSYKYANGSEIVLFGLEDITRIMSAEFDMIYVAESIEVSLHDWQLLGTRLRASAMPYRVLIADTNPGPPNHWVKERAQEGLLHLLPTYHEDNPAYYDHDTDQWTSLGKEYLAGLDTLQGHLKDRMRYGKWVTPDGARWPQLDERLHRFSARDEWGEGLPESSHLIIGLDWGLKAPYCALWLACDTSGDLWVFREDYRAGLTTDKQASEVVRQTRQNEIIRYIYADPNMWSRTQTHTGQVQKSDADYFKKAFERDDNERASAGLPQRFGSLMKGYNQSRKIALSTIDSMLNTDNGYPNLHIDYSCTNLWKELSNAVWDPRAALREDIDPKCADHAITALYYACHSYIEVPKSQNPPWPSQEEILAIRNKENIESERRAFARRYRRPRY